MDWSKTKARVKNNQAADDEINVRTYGAYSENKFLYAATYALMFLQNNPNTLVTIVASKSDIAEINDFIGGAKVRLLNFQKAAYAKHYGELIFVEPTARPDLMRYGDLLSAIEPNTKSVTSYGVMTPSLKEVVNG